MESEGPYTLESLLSEAIKVMRGKIATIRAGAKAAWLGRSVAQEPEATNGAFCRAHGAVRFLEAEAGRWSAWPPAHGPRGREGRARGQRGGRQLRRHFRNSEADVIADGSHALFVDRKGRVREVPIYVRGSAGGECHCFPCFAFTSSPLPCVQVRAHSEGAIRSGTHNACILLLSFR